MWSQLVETKLHVLLLHIFLWMSSVGLMIPHLTILAANDFASSPGHRIQCETSLGAAPPECRHANAVTVTWVAWSSFFQNAILGVWFLPLIGLLSDQQGRLRFMIAGQVLVALPLMWVFFHVSDPAEVPFKGYFVLDALKGVINPMSLCLSYAADKIPPEDRATMFGWQLGTMSLAVIISAVTGAFLGPAGATTFALMLVFSNIMLIVFRLPESVTEECKRLAEQHRHKASLTAGWEGVREGFAIVTRSTLFMRLALLMAVTGMVFECLKDVLFNYLMVKLSFSSHHFAKIMAVMGIGSLGVQLGLLPTLLRLVGEKWVLVIALACSTVEMSMLAAASNEVMVYISISVGTLGSMAFPGISALKSNLSHPSEQGVVQGALFAARGIAQGIGPLAFSALFNHFVEPEHYMPGAPLIGAAIIMGFGFLIALTLNIPDGEPRTSDSGAAVPLETNMSLYGAPSLSESSDIERLLGTGERSSEMAHLTASESETRSPLKSYVLTLQTRSSFHSNR